MAYRAREDIRTSHHINVALLYQEMLGTQAAKDYLGRMDVPCAIIERVLSTTQRRLDPAVKRTRHDATPYPGCRRKNRVQEAVVSAAIKIAARQGDRWARTLLESEKVPADVVARVLAMGGDSIRKQNT
jgi:hypothetical protein